MLQLQFCDKIIKLSYRYKFVTKLSTHLTVISLWQNHISSYSFSFFHNPDNYFVDLFETSISSGSDAIVTLEQNYYLLYVVIQKL
jgi:hypothetical protein